MNRKLLIHDFAGHPFQAQLSRSLAVRGYRTTHAYCSNVATGIGDLQTRRGDPAELRFHSLAVGDEFPRHSLTRRPAYEWMYGTRVATLAQDLRPHVVISANTPLMSQRALWRNGRRLNAALIYWVQDLLGVGTKRQLTQRFGRVGSLVGNALVRLESQLLAASDQVVLISEDFKEMVGAGGSPPESMSVIENWAPLDEIPLRPKVNSWSTAVGIAQDFVFLYAGTLGLKHDPSVLVALALERPHCKVVVISEGPGADWLKQEGHSQGLSNLEVLDYQPYHRLPEVLASGDVLVGLLEAEAGVFSVPSKVLTYHCAGRPLLCAIPHENLAAKIVERNRSGIVVQPGDNHAFLAAARRLAEDALLRDEMGSNARTYAEGAFDIEKITDRFEEVIDKALIQRRLPSSSASVKR